MFSSASFFYVRLRTYMLNTRQWTSLRVLSTPFLYVGRKNAAQEVNPNALFYFYILLQVLKTKELSNLFKGCDVFILGKACRYEFKYNCDVLYSIRNVQF